MYEDSVYQQFIYVSRYAKYLDREKRRETWPETVARYFDFMESFMREEYAFDFSSYRPELEQAVLDHEGMPSMRGLMTAGPALKRDPGAIFNCAYIPIDSLRSFDETLYTLMLGSGMGFSVEKQYISKLPTLPDEFYESDTVIVFEDSRTGWAKGFREWMSLLAVGQIPKYDVSKIRPMGAKLKIFGGRASGPDPLVDLLTFSAALFRRAAGRKLSTIECHDLVCKIAEIVVVGGVRRSALISLSDLSDDRMRDCKKGQWWVKDNQRSLSNNSAVYESKPDIGTFMREWISLYESKSGERGIISRPAMRTVINNANDFRKLLNQDAGEELYRLRDPDHEFGTNPCVEIILRELEFCNLTEVIIRPDDTEESLVRKIRIATILGTFQACLSNFRFINKKWQRNCEDERLLGVSLTGIFDNILTNGYGPRPALVSLLTRLKRGAIVVNRELASKIGINSSVAITCVKPSGTSSALNGTSSGIHPAHSAFYIRHVRNSTNDPVTKFMIDAGVPHEIDFYNQRNVVFKFPLKSPCDSIFKSDVDAISHLELWLIYQKYWCEHKPSITVSVRESEWLAVGAWCYENFEWLSGVSFLPAEEDGHTYRQAPFSACSREEYDQLVAQMPEKIDWKKLPEYELEDTTTSSHELACTGAGGCEV
jgi:ribonucleoside-diphosphate reductase alpha chain